MRVSRVGIALALIYLLVSGFVFFMKYASAGTTSYKGWYVYTQLVLAPVMLPESLFGFLPSENSFWNDIFIQAAISAFVLYLLGGGIGDVFRLTGRVLSVLSRR